MSNVESLRLDLNLVTNKPAALNTLSASTEVGDMTSRDLERLSRAGVFLPPVMNALSLPYLSCIFISYLA